MTTKLMIASLRRAKNGEQMLSMLNAFADVNQERETVVSVMLPSSGMILDHQGREVTF